MSDKRTVSTDALETLGTIIGPGEKRDAIHLAVIPVIAGQDLLPGQDVGVSGCMAITACEKIGIVDPFLTKLVSKGQYFWLVIYPRKITSLRHVWSHPAFDDADVPALAVPTSQDDELRSKIEKLEAEKRELESRVDELDCGC